MDIISLLPLIARFRETMLALCRSVASRNDARLDGALGYWAAQGVVRRDVLSFAYQRIAGVRALMEALVARMQAGTLRRGSAGPRGTMAVRGTRDVSPLAVVTRRFGWLCPLVQSDAACQAQYLRQILAEPEMQRLLAEVPQARRILTPVLHMVGIRLDRLMLEVSPPVVEEAMAPVVPAGGFWAYEPGFLGGFRGVAVVRNENGPENRPENGLGG